MTPVLPPDVTPWLEMPLVAQRCKEAGVGAATCFLAKVHHDKPCLVTSCALAVTPVAMTQM